MFRTRDFVLFFTTIIFLVMAIGVTVLKQEGTEARQNVIVPDTTSELTGSEVVVENEAVAQLDRDARLADLRRKIEQSQLVTITEPVPDPEEVSETALSEVLITGAPQLCPGYQTNTALNWPVSAVEVTAAEGVRQYYTTTEVSLGTSTASTTLSRNILLTLPTQFVPLGSESCISSDIIGVAIDGSLIRNSEVSLYSVFGSGTLIGYALDGFPIYGSGTLPTDACGGRIELGQYRYELSADRSTIINCYVGSPQTFMQ